MNSKLLDPHVESLETVFESYFSIPVFQRPYCWEKDQIKELLADIYNYYEHKKTSEFYIGSVYLARSNSIGSSINCFEVIDGQQRMTTLSLVLLVLYYYAVKYNLQEDESVSKIKSLLWKKIDARKPNKNYPIILFNSIEKNIMKTIFDTAYDSLIEKDNYSEDNDFLKLVQNITASNNIETNIKNNIKLIDANLKDSIFTSKEEGERKDRLLSYIDFILCNIKFLTLIVDKDDTNKLFEIFESINSKGKKLDEIDIIKSYIFQNIKPSDYEDLLKKWGDLIIATKDNLQDYLYVYIKAFIKYYRVGLSSTYFKTTDFVKYYKKDNLSDALKELLNDLTRNVNLYNYILDGYIINTSKFKYYLSCFRLNEYEHPKALLFRTFYEYNQGNITKNDLTSILKNSFSYMFISQTICDGDSKDAIEVFENIMTTIIEEGVFNVDRIIDEFRNSLSNKGIGKDYIKNRIENFIGYADSKEKAASRVILASYELTKKGKMNYDQGFLVLNNTNIFQIDHILPQTPKPDEDKFSYYPLLIRKGKYQLVLKKKHDFNIEEVQDGMDYANFTKKVLNKIGNLRILYRKDNDIKSNCAVKLPGYSDFNTYEKILERSSKLSKQLVKNELFQIEK